ncbi:MAG TPA: transcriptional repressor LexA [Pedomonas sp.]|nr:transcriptional repressor LexA [Pedomonas sp.]
MLTRKQHDLLIFIHNRLETTGISPSFEEMKEALGLKSKSGVHRLVNALVERNFIRRLPNRARALEVLRLPEAATPARTAGLQLATDRDAAIAASGNVVRGSFGKKAPPVAAAFVEIPLHGRIAAGLPVEALESDRQLAVPPALLGPGDHFALEVSGDSMVEAGILDGDYAIVRKAEHALDGDIIVALVDDGEATLKRLHRKEGKVRLEPANAAYKTQIYDPQRVRIQGKLVGLMRRY